MFENQRRYVTSLYTGAKRSQQINQFLMQLII